ncbi:MAG: ATP-binding protein [Candidatus Micrarchaeota archaeon]
MYFEIEPKGRKEDFFNYDYEYGQVKKALERKEKIIAVVGVRRVGKTSLLNLIYNETSSLKLWLDGRIVTAPKKEVFAAIYETIEAGTPKIFGKIESLNLSAFGVGLGIELGSENRAEIEKKIKASGQVRVFIDEAQRMNCKDLADVLSYFYDRFPNVSFLISGSEVGLVEEILGENDGEHPLYGREISKVTINRLDRNRAMDYLKEGFKQLGLEVSPEELEKAIDELDGLIGWLTLYGYEKGVKKNKDALNKTGQTAARIAASELVHFLKKTRNKKLYLSILRNASGTGWEQLRALAGKDYGKKLNSNLFTYALNKLAIHSFIEKKDRAYNLSDPLLAKAIYLV